MKNLILVAYAILFTAYAICNYGVNHRTTGTGYSDVPGTFDQNTLPTSADVVIIRAGDTLKVRNHFYCKDIIFETNGNVKSVLSCANLSFIHKGQ
jgi:hypothetical protein